MILRRRFPDGRNLDHDMGPGPVGNTRGYTSRVLGAVLLTDAIAPSLPKGTVTPPRKRDDYFKRRDRERKNAWQRAKRAKA